MIGDGRGHGCSHFHLWHCSPRQVAMVRKFGGSIAFARPVDVFQAPNPRHLDRRPDRRSFAPHPDSSRATLAIMISRCLASRAPTRTCMRCLPAAHKSSTVGGDCTNSAIEIPRVSINLKRRLSSLTGTAQRMPLISTEVNCWPSEKMAFS